MSATKTVTQGSTHQPGASASWRRRLAQALDVRPEEGRLVRWLLLHSFLTGIPRVLTSTAAMALFLAHFAASDLPLVYIAAAAAVPLVGLVRLRLAARLSLSRLATLDLSFVAAVLVVLRVGLGVSWSAPIYFVLPIWYEVEWVVLSLEFGALAGGLLDVRQGKRLFGLVGSGELVAGCLAGAAAPFLVALLGTANLLLVSAGAVLTSIVVVRVMAPLDASAAVATPRPGSRPRQKTPVRSSLVSRYLLLLFALVTLSYLGYYVVDNAFYILARRVIPEADRLASALGVFWGVVSLGTLVTRALAAGRLLERYGLLATLLALPAALALGVTLVVLGDVLGGAAFLLAGLMAVTRMLDQVLRDSLERSTLLVLYQPLPTRERLRTQTAVEGIVGPLAGGIAGVFLLALVKGLGVPVVPLLSLLLVLVVLWMAVAVGVRREYTRVLARALQDRRLTAAPDAFRDPAARALLIRGLRSEHPREVLDCVEILAHLGSPDLPRLVAPLLDHPDAVVRLAALEQVRPPCPTAVVEAVRRHAREDSDRAVRAMAVRALAVVGYDDDLTWITQRIESADPVLRRAALVALAQNGAPEGLRMVGVALRQDLSSEDPALRASVAGVVGESRVRELDRVLSPLMDDSSLEVRRAAIEAAGRLDSEALWPRVVAALAEPSVCAAALKALERAGERALPVMMAALERSHDPVGAVVQRRLVRLCGKVPGPGAAAALWHLAGVAPRELRRATLAALASRGDRAQGERIAAVRRGLAREASEAAQTTADQVALEGMPGSELVVRALDRELDGARERVLTLLSLLGHKDVVARARLNLASPSQRVRAQAVELIDSALPGDLRAMCVPLLDDLSPADRHRRLPTSAKAFPDLPQVDRLAAIAADPEREPWLRACALVVASHLPSDGRDLPLAEVASDQALVRETALWLQSRASGDSAHGHTGESLMLSTIEKVLILRGVSIFSETPDDVLADVAGLLEEEEHEAGETIFEKGDMGSALFVVVAGRVRVHADGRTLRELGEREIFGEMAALDPEARSASITTLVRTRLFRLDQEPLYDLMADRIEVVRGVIRVLCRRLRTVPA